MKLLANISKGTAQFNAPSLQALEQFYQANEGKTVMFEVRKYSEFRTTKQNSLYWLMLAKIAAEMKSAAVFEDTPSEEDLHLFFKHKFLPTKQVHFFAPSTGEEFRIEGIVSSAELTKTEFSDYIEQITEFCINNFNFNPL